MTHRRAQAIQLMRLLACTAILFAMAPGAESAQVSLNFSELTAQPVNGLTINGVTFGFTVNGAISTDATYNFALGQNMTYLQDSVMEGTTAGALQLDFAAPTSFLQFGAALATLDPLTPGFWVERFNPSYQSMGIDAVSTNALVFFSEGQFTYNGPAISRAIVTFSPSADRFAFDNLGFETPAGVPEPGTMMLLGAGLILIPLAGRRRKPARSRQ